MSDLWNLSNIPKIAHFYWGSTKLSFLRFMSLYSFKKLNPDWRVILHVPFKLNAVHKWAHKQHELIYHVEDYFKHVESCGIEISVLNMEDLGFSNDMNEVHKSDIARYHLLSKFGGIWSDMDILYIKPIDKFFHNEVSPNTEIDSYYYYGTDKSQNEILGHAIGFLLSAKDAPLFTDIFNKTLQMRVEKDYEGFGAGLLNTHFKKQIMDTAYPHSKSFHKETVYAIDHNNRKYLYEKDGAHYLGKYSVGIHWYGGSEYVLPLITGVNHKNYLTFVNKGTFLAQLRKVFPQGISI